MDTQASVPVEAPASDLAAKIAKAYEQAQSQPSSWVNESKEKVERPAYYIEPQPDGTTKGVYRLSALMDCPRALWAARNLKVAQPVYEQVRKAAVKGHEFEPKVKEYLLSIGWEPLGKQELEALGFKVDTNGQVLVEIPVGKDIIIRGHCDNIVRQMTPVMGIVKKKKMVEEPKKEGAKTMVKRMVEYEEEDVVRWESNPQGELRVHEGKAQIDTYVKSFMRTGLAEFPRYKGQLTGYMFGLKLKGIYTFFDPSTRCMEEHPNVTGCMGVHRLIDEMPVSPADLMQRVLQTEKAFLENQAPDCGPYRQKSSYVCNYRYLHDEPQAVQQKIPSHPELEDLLSLYKKATESESELEEFKKRIQSNVKEIMGANKTITAGKWKPQIIESTTYLFDETAFCNDHPELYGKYIRERKSTQFRLYENKQHNKEEQKTATAQVMKDLEAGKFLGPVNQDLTTPVQAIVQAAPIVQPEPVVIPEAVPVVNFQPAALPAEVFPEPAPPIPPPVVAAIPAPSQLVTCPSCQGWGGYSDGSVCQVCNGARQVVQPNPQPVYQQPPQIAFSQEAPQVIHAQPTHAVFEVSAIVPQTLEEAAAPKPSVEALFLPEAQTQPSPTPIEVSAGATVNSSVAGFGSEVLEEEEPGKAISGAVAGPQNGAGSGTAVPSPASTPSPTDGTTVNAQDTADNTDLVPCRYCQGTGEGEGGKVCAGCSGIAWFHPSFPQP